jgi:hypothetical protein
MEGTMDNNKKNCQLLLNKPKYQSLLIIFTLVFLLQACKDPVHRTGPLYEGSAYWALAIAQPKITAFSSDAKVYSIVGAIIQTDGRLFVDAGGWSFIAYSPSLQKELTAQVIYDGTVTTKTENRTTPSGRGYPIPDGWLNSTDIFQIVSSHLNGSTSQVNMLVFNWDNYPEARGQAIWVLSYSHSGGNHKVKWDGTYLPQSQ